MHGKVGLVRAFLQVPAEGTVLEGGGEGVEFCEGGMVDGLQLLDGYNASGEITLKGNRWNWHFQASKASHANTQAGLSEYKTTSHAFGSTLVKQSTDVVRVCHASVHAQLNAVRLVQGDWQPLGLDAGAKVGIAQRTDQDVARPAFVLLKPPKVIFRDICSVVIQELTTPNVLKPNHSDTIRTIVFSLEIRPKGPVRKLCRQIAES